jgi:fibronectin type 3 domain-containing protein
VTNASGRMAGPSNSATVFLAPAMPPPSAVNAKLEPDAVVLQWNSPPLPESGKLRTQYFYKVVRQAEGDQQPNVLQILPATPGGMSFRDTQFEWEKTYRYEVVGLTRVVSLEGALLSGFEGEPSPEARIVAHDVVPPAPPADVQAVYSEVAGRRFIDVTWSPSPSSDVAGYNLYRQRQDGSWQRLNPQLITTPSFRDNAVQPGNTYSYQATAVDARGNESTPSAPEQEKVPE